MSILNELTWIDWTSLAILAYFLIMGLFRGFLWQASRLVSIVLSWVLASLFAGDLAAIIEKNFSGLEGQASYYVAFFSILIAVLVVLSIITIILDRFVKKLELSFYNHLGGGILGVATAAGIVIAALGLLYKVMPQSNFTSVARQSYTGDVSLYIVERVGLPDEIRVLYESGDEPAKEQEGK